jgi:signal transduction histidine kinase
MSLSRDIAHSLKDMLNVIVMYGELMAGAVENSAFPAAQIRHAARCADVIRRELRRLDRSLEVLLDSSMTERTAPQTFDVKAICESLLLLVAARASSQHVALTSALDTGPTRMWGFPDQMHQALLGLIINALDAMPNGGTLHLALMKGRTLRIHVSDSGPGIEPNRLSEDQQLAFTTKALTSGLGLYVTRSVVEAHGGTLLNEPAVSGGRCFIVELPIRAQH